MPISLLLPMALAHVCAILLSFGHNALQDVLLGLLGLFYRLQWASNFMLVNTDFFEKIRLAGTFHHIRRRMSHMGLCLAVVVVSSCCSRRARQFRLKKQHRSLCMMMRFNAHQVEDAAYLVVVVV